MTELEMSELKWILIDAVFMIVYIRVLVINYRKNGIYISKEDINLWR